jgi:hypothetical protein
MPTKDKKSVRLFREVIPGAQKEPEPESKENEDPMTQRQSLATQFDTMPTERKGLISKRRSDENEGGEENH